MTYGVSRAFGFPRLPFRRHVSVQLGRVGSEVFLFTSSRVPSHRHVLHERPQVQRVGVVPDDRSKRSSGLSVLLLAYLGVPFLVIAEKNRGSTANHVIFDEMMQIFILLVKQHTLFLLRKVVEQVEQGQIGFADTLFEHVYATLLVEGKLSVDGLQKGDHIHSVVPYEKVSQSRHAVVAPCLLTTGVILFGNTFFLHSPEEGLFWWKTIVVVTLQTVHVLLRKMTFRDLASVPVHILVVAKPRGYAIGHV